jgi:hypothetical protein
VNEKGTLYSPEPPEFTPRTRQKYSVAASRVTDGVEDVSVIPPRLTTLSAKSLVFDTCNL